MALIYKSFQSTLPNKDGEYLYYPRLVKIGNPVTTLEIARKIAWATSLTVGDVIGVLYTLMNVVGDNLMNSRSVKLDGLGTFTMVSKASGTGVKTEKEVSSSQITGLRCQFTPEYTRRAGNKGITRALTENVEYVSLASFLRGASATEGNNPGDGDDGYEQDPNA